MRTYDLNSPKRQVGFDSQGEVFTVNNNIFRGIYKGRGNLVRKVIHICNKYNIYKYGIVRTKILSKNPYPDLQYELVLEHEKVPFISYPHEWSSSMLKDSALFHIGLFKLLNKYGLIFKDWHPYNILFKNTKPVFVDITSIIPLDYLPKEKYLTPPHAPNFFSFLWDTTSKYYYEMYWRMYEPCFLLPLYLMHQKRHKKARRLMFKKALNTGATQLKEEEVFRLFSLTKARFEIMEFCKKLSLIDRDERKNVFLNLLKREIECLDVSLGSLDYTNYYKEKKEYFNFKPSRGWTNKQIVVYETIKHLKPKTLLDVGSNTGWFSILAAKSGCEVVAFDIDEACVDILYDYAKCKKLSILPLVVDITKGTKDIFPSVSEKEPSPSLIKGTFPLLLSPEKRFKSDMVLALAMIHHFILGEGLNFKQVIQTLDRYTKKYLVIEFVALNDKMIINEPTFFPSFNSHPRKFEWYTLNNFIRELSKYFRDIEIKKSYPDSRVTLICTK